MITNYRIFEASISKQAQLDAMKEELVATLEQILDLRDEIELKGAKLKTSSARLQTELEQLGHFSVVCKDVIFEIIGEYESSRFDMKDFDANFSTIVADLGDLGQLVQEGYDKAIELSTTITPASSSLRVGKRTKKQENDPSGTIHYEAFGDNILRFISRIKAWFRSFFTRAESKLQELVNKYNLSVNVNFGAVTESKSINERAINKDGGHQIYLIDTPDIKRYIGRSITKKMVVETLAVSAPSFQELVNQAVGEGRSKTGVSLVLSELMHAGLVERKGGSARSGAAYTLTQTGADLIGGYVSVSTTPVAGGTPKQVDEVDPGLIADALDSIADDIEEQEDVLLENIQDFERTFELNQELKTDEAKLKLLNERAVALMKELGVSSVALRDKSISITNRKESSKVSTKQFQEFITDAETVGEEVADIMISMIPNFMKTGTTSGYTRFSKGENEGEFADGTVNKKFNWDTKTIEGKVNENIFKRGWNYIVNLFNRFIKRLSGANKKMLALLDTI